MTWIVVGTACAAIIIVALSIAYVAGSFAKAVDRLTERHRDD